MSQDSSRSFTLLNPKVFICSFYLLTSSYFYCKQFQTYTQVGRIIKQTPEYPSLDLKTNILLYLLNHIATHLFTLHFYAFQDKTIYLIP